MFAAPKDPVAGARASSAQPPRLLFISLTNSVGGGERTIGEMARMGAQCAVLSPPGFYCQATQFAKRRYVLPPQLGIWLANPFVWPALEMIERTWRPDLVLPLDDISASLLKGLAIRRRASARLKLLMLRSMGSSHGFQAASCRAELMRLAEQMGLKHPISRSVGPIAAFDKPLPDLGFPVVVKREWTCGGCGVSIAADKAALQRALAREPWHVRAATYLRALLKQMMWSAAGQLRLPNDHIQIQSFVRGQLAIRTVAVWEGRELGGMSFLAERVHPAPTGSSTVVAPFEHEEMALATRRLVAELGCSGIVSFDFVIEEDTCDPHLIEINPRAIGVSHLGRLFGHDICRALLQQLGWAPPTEVPYCSAPSAVALFPKELARESKSAWIGRPDTLHDVPWEDLGLLESYRRTHRITGCRSNGSIETYKDLSVQQSASQA